MIVDELAGIKPSRLLYVPALCSTLWSAYGVFIRDWKIDELFFWFWFELLLSGVSGILLIYRWQRMQPTGSIKSALREAAITALVFLMIGFFGTMFAAMAWSTNFKSVAAVPAYMEVHRVSVTMIVCGFCAAHFIVVHRPVFAQADKNDILRPLTNKMFAVLGLYFFLIMQYHLTGSRTLDVTESYVKMMAAALLGTKLLVEIRHLCLGPRVKAIKPQKAAPPLPQRESF